MCDYLGKAWSVAEMTASQERACASCCPDVPSTISKNASHEIGVGAFVLNAKGAWCRNLEDATRKMPTGIWKMQEIVARLLVLSKIQLVLPSLVNCRCQEY